MTRGRTGEFGTGHIRTSQVGVRKVHTAEVGSLELPLHHGGTRWAGVSGHAHLADHPVVSISTRIKNNPASLRRGCLLYGATR